MTLKIMEVDTNHRNAATQEHMPQYTRADLRHDNGDFIMFWNVGTILYLDRVAAEIEQMQELRLGARKLVAE